MRATESGREQTEIQLAIPSALHRPALRCCQGSCGDFALDNRAAGGHLGVVRHVLGVIEGGGGGVDGEERRARRVGRGDVDARDEVRVAEHLGGRLHELVLRLVGEEEGALKATEVANNVPAVRLRHEEAAGGGERAAAEVARAVLANDAAVRADDAAAVVVLLALGILEVEGEGARDGAVEHAEARVSRLHLHFWKRDTCT